MPSRWEASKDYSKTFHPGAEMNIRTSLATAGENSNQAIYDINRNIIKSGLVLMLKTKSFSSTNL